MGALFVKFFNAAFVMKNKLDSFRSYRLVEADLLVCMPARGDRIKVRFDEIDKTLRSYIIFQQHPKIPKSKNVKKTRISNKKNPKPHKIN